MFTKELRHQIYIRLLAAYNTRENYNIFDQDIHGFCALYRAVYGSNELYQYFDLILPELYNKRTIRERARFYWENWTERLTALNECIEETKPNTYEQTTNE